MHAAHVPHEMTAVTCSTPEGVPDRCTHSEDDGSEREYMCSTPEGVTDRCTDRDTSRCRHLVVLNARGRH